MGIEGERKALRRSRRRQRLRASTRGVLEGFPLTVIISIMIVAVGSLVLIGLFEYSHSTTLGSLSFQTPMLGAYPGYLTNTSTQLEVTAWAASGGTLSGVQIVLNGTDVSERGLTAGNGSAFFWVDPSFRDHATSGVISISALYAPGVSLVSQPTQTYSTTVLVLA